MTDDAVNADFRVNPNVAGVSSHRTYNCVYQPFIDLNFKTHPRAANDLVLLWDIPAGFFVAGLGAKMLTAVTSPTSGVTADFGDYTRAAAVEVGDNVTIVDVDGFIDGFDVHATTPSYSGPGVVTQGTPSTWAPAYANGKAFTAAGVIGMLVLGDAPVNGILRVSMIGWYFVPPYEVLTA